MNKQLDIWMDSWQQHTAGRCLGRGIQRGTFVSAGHPLQRRDVIVMLPDGECEHAHLSEQRGYSCGHSRTALSCPGPSSGQPPIMVEPHRPVGPIVLLEDILHTIFAPIREHHDHLITVSSSDVGLIKGEHRVRQSLVSHRSRAGPPSSGR